MPYSPSSTIHVKVDLDTPAVKRIVRNLVFQYSEWLDSEGLIVGDTDSGDKRTHEDLVNDFLGDEFPRRAAI